MYIQLHIYTERHFKTLRPVYVKKRVNSWVLEPIKGTTVKFSLAISVTYELFGLTVL